MITQQSLKKKKLSIEIAKKSVKQIFKTLKFSVFPDFPGRLSFNEKMPKGKLVANRVRYLHTKSEKNRWSRFRENPRKL